MQVSRLHPPRSRIRCLTARDNETKLVSSFYLNTFRRLGNADRLCKDGCVKKSVGDSFDGRAGTVIRLTEVQGVKTRKGTRWVQLPSPVETSESTPYLTLIKRRNHFLFFTTPFDGSSPPFSCRIEGTVFGKLLGINASVGQSHSIHLGNRT